MKMEMTLRLGVCIMLWSQSHPKPQSFISHFDKDLKTVWSNSV